ncbi:hypothetical protein DSM106972_068550 [Dulcicalothrix desertica PCC 7102]|uniref:Leucine rich repeat variant n=1 Tax=Dulcicalothrix desertica PCC 7102 TaxID=232991 RepID=A0A433V5D1_9CYAN|nr:hypothetical protein DSM106972_068550 [Dulcicalothrix desertica PCC 7102]
MVKLLELDTIPTDWMVMAANRNSKNDYPVLETLVKSLRTPASALSKLLKIEDSGNKIGDTIALSAQMHVNYAGEITEGWEEAAKNLISECELYCHDDSVFELWKFGTIPKSLLGALSHQVKLEIVDDLTIPAHTLETLAKNTRSDSILTKLAGNPNTPLSTIDKLATTYNQVDFTAFIYNPTIPLSLLQKYCQQKSTAKFTNLIELQKKRNLANNKNQQVHTLELKFLDTESRERYDIACNLNTSIDILKKLAEDQIWLIRKAVALNPNTPIDILDKLAEDSSSQVKDAVLETCKNIFEKSEFLDSIFTKLVNTKDASVIWQIVCHPCTADNILEKLAQDNKYYSWIICHPNAPLQLLVKCIYDSNSKLKKEALELLWRKLLLNPKIFVDVMQILKNSYLNKYDIKIALARYPNTSVEILNDLAQDSDIRIRTLVAKHANTSIEVLTNLLEDKDNHVRLAAIQNYQENADKYLTNSDKLLENWQALQNPKISESQLVRLAKHKNAIIREAVALHSNTPADILAKLANDKHVAVRIGAAQNPNTPLDIIEKLAQTKTKKFQAAKTAAIKVLVINYPEKASLYLQTYINTPTPSFSRFIGLLYVGAKSDFLANNSDSLSWVERYAVAQHLNTPQDILSQLKNDPNRIVRAAAKANLLH